MGEVALDANRCGDLLMLGIFGAVIKRQGSPHGGRELSTSGNYCPPCLRSIFPGQSAQQKQSALSLGKTIEGRSAFPGEKAVSLPVTVASSTVNRSRSGVYRHTVGNLGFTDFPSNAFLFALLVGSSQTTNEFCPAVGLRMVDILIDCLVADALLRMFQGQSSSYKLGGPAKGKSIMYVAPYDPVL